MPKDDGHDEHLTNKTYGEKEEEEGEEVKQCQQQQQQQQPTRLENIIKNDCNEYGKTPTSTTISTETTTKPPLLSVEDIKCLCQKFFDINYVERVKELNSYDDRNYNIVARTGEASGKNNDSYDTNGVGTQRQFVLKITNTNDSNEPELIEGQNSMLLHLHGKHFNVPFPIKNCQGNFVVRCPLPLDHVNDVEKKKLYAIRALAFVPGTILYGIQMNHKILFDCGQYLARVDLALDDFHHEAVKQRKFPWMLSQVPALKKYLNYVGESSKRQMIAECIQEFESLSTESMVHSYIHGDFNEQNIILKETGNPSQPYQVFGLIDFGDVCYAPRIFDLATFIAYLMLLDIGEHLDPVLDAPRFALQGYRTEIPLKNEQIRVVLVLAKARLCQSLTLGAYTYSIQPGNEYLLTTAKKGWPILQQLHQINPTELIHHWNGKVNEPN